MKKALNNPVQTILLPDFRDYFVYLMNLTVAVSSLDVNQPLSALRLLDHLPIVFLTLPVTAEYVGASRALNGATELTSNNRSVIITPSIPSLMANMLLS